jgi:hypothetical protein
LCTLTHRHRLLQHLSPHHQPSGELLREVTSASSPTLVRIELCPRAVRVTGTSVEEGASCCRRPAHTPALPPQVSRS